MHKITRRQFFYGLLEKGFVNIFYQVSSFGAWIFFAYFLHFDFPLGHSLHLMKFSVFLASCVSPNLRDLSCCIHCRWRVCGHFRESLSIEIEILLSSLYCFVINDPCQELYFLRGFVINRHI